MRVACFGFAVALGCSFSSCGFHALPACDEAARTEPRPPLAFRSLALNLTKARSRQPYELVFVSVGYSDAELPSFRARVDELVAGLATLEDSPVRTHPDLFRFHRVDVADDLADGASDFGACWAPDDFGATPFLSLDTRALEEAMQRVGVSNPVPIAVFNVGGGRANATIVMRHVDDAALLLHELGHHVFGLGDEYVDTDQVAARPPPVLATTGPTEFSIAGATGAAPQVRPFPPNVTADPDGRKWAALVPGAWEGAQRVHGLYGPAAPCRMRDASQSFCPVCAAHIALLVRHRLGEVDGPPRCDLSLLQLVDQPQQDWLVLSADDLDGLLRFTLEQGPMPGSTLNQTLEFDLPWAADTTEFAWTTPVFPRADHTVRAACADTTGLRVHVTLAIP